jgi:hypothetical protein
MNVHFKNVMLTGVGITFFRDAHFIFYFFSSYLVGIMGKDFKNSCKVFTHSETLGHGLYGNLEHAWLHFMQTRILVSLILVKPAASGFT